MTWGWGWKITSVKRSFKFLNCISPICIFLLLFFLLHCFFNSLIFISLLVFLLLSWIVFIHTFKLFTFPIPWLFFPNGYTFRCFILHSHPHKSLPLPPSQSLHSLSHKLVSITETIKMLDFFLQIVSSSYSFLFFFFFPKDFAEAFISTFWQISWWLRLQQ